MKLNVKQSPLNSTLLSSVKGAYEYYHKKSINDALLFGLSGHAFVVNITKGVGPCAPYWWNMKTFFSQCKNYIGVELFSEEISATLKSDDTKKKEITTYIKEALDEGYVILLSSLEYQLIIGYEDDHFIITQPWNHAPSETKSIAFDSLEGMRNFMTVSKMLPRQIGDIKEGIIKSIEYGISLFENPSSIPEYAMGIKAYDYWIEQMENIGFDGQGLWWSSTVWSESRRFASEYMKLIKEYFNSDEILDELSEKYTISAGMFAKLADKLNYTKEEKIEFIKELKIHELTIYELLKQLV